MNTGGQPSPDPAVGGLSPVDGAPAQVPSPWNAANALTILRLLLVPVFAWSLLHAGGNQSGWRITAAAVFVLAVFTDGLDGDLARRHGLITDFGKIVDPVADKSLIGTALVGLSLLGELPWWVTAVVLVREVTVTLIRLVVLRYGVMAAGGAVRRRPPSRPSRSPCSCCRPGGRLGTRSRTG